MHSRTHRCIHATEHRRHTGAFQNPPVCFRTHRCILVWVCTERTGVFLLDPVEYTPVRFRTHQCVLNLTVVGFEPGRAETCASKCCAQPIELPLHCLTMMNPSHTTRLSYHSSPLHGTHPTSCMHMLRTTLHLTSCVLKDDHQRRRRQRQLVYT